MSPLAPVHDRKKPMNKTVQVVVFDTRPINGWLQQWLNRFKHVWLTSKLAPSEYGGMDFLAVKRNRTIKRFLSETKPPWLLMLDDDIIPLDGLADCPNTWPLIESDKDVASARFVAKKGNEAHGRKGDVALAAVKISRNALKRMGAPWSHFDFDEDEAEMKRCECDYFAAKAKEAGFFPVKAGAVGHIVTAAVIPAPKPSKEAMCRIKLLSQLHREGQKRPPVPPQKIAIPGRTK